jgi:molecular chaperone GrpE
LIFSKFDFQIFNWFKALCQSLTNHHHPQVKTWANKVSAVNRKFLSVLGKRQLVPIELESQEPDFNLCRVVDQEERTDVPDQTITKIVRRGFRWGEKILRPTEVITAKAKSTLDDNLDGNIDET